MYKLLIVDDEPLICEGLKMIVNWSNLGIELCGAALSGEDALEILAEADISIMITDIRMPGLSGIELIERALALRPNLKCIVLSSYGDYALIRSAMRTGAVDYLLKPIAAEDLEEAVINASASLEKASAFPLRIPEEALFHHMMQQIVTGEILPRDKRERLEYFQIDPVFKAAFLMAVRFSAGSELLLPYFHQFFDRQNAHVLVFSDRQGNACCLVLETDMLSTQAVLSERFREMLAAFQQIYNGSMHAVLEPPVSSWRQVPELYRNCLRDLDCCGMYNLLLLERTNRHPIPADCVAVPALRACLMQSDSKAIDRYLEGLLPDDEIAGELDDYRIIDVLNHAVEIAEGFLICRERIEGIKPETIRLLCALPDRIARKHALSKALNAIEKALTEQQNPEYSPLITRSVQYINANFHDDNLCLKTLADLFSVNPSYLGRQFKAEIGEYFNDYLARIRIRRAEHLLRTSTLRISDIAQQVGFSSINYFGIVFKKITSCTPSDSRKTASV